MFSENQQIAERQKVLLRMVKELDVMFSSSKIEYSLAAGTLLGAVRESGFIPWDDDIDIMVNRANFNRIKCLFEGEGNNRYSLKRYLWTYRIQLTEDSKSSSIMVPTIDVFIGDRRPSSNAQFKAKLLLLKMLQGMLKEQPSYEGLSAVYRACLFVTVSLGKLFSHDKLFRMYDRISQIGERSDYPYLTFCNGEFRFLDMVFRDTLFGKFIRTPFENIVLPITSEYDYFLQASYGEYMTPPAESERVSKHVSVH